MFFSYLTAGSLQSDAVDEQHIHLALIYTNLFYFYSVLSLYITLAAVQITSFYYIEKPWFLRQNERWLRKRGGGMAVPMVSVRLHEIELVGSYI